MRLWNARFGRKRESKSIQIGLDNDTGRLLLFGYEGTGATATTPSSALELYQQSTAVSIPINKITDPFSVIGLALLSGSEVIRDHPVLDLLKRPSPFHSQELFLEVLMKDYLITGEAFIVAIGNVDKPPLQLHPVSPSVVSPIRTDTDAPRQWMVTGITFTGTYEALPDLFDPKMRYLDGDFKELKHVRAYSPRNNSLLRGQSRLVSAAKEARQHVLGTQHNVTLLENGGRISLVFHFEENIDPQDFKDIKRRINEQYSGALQAGTIGVTSGGKLKIEELGRTAKDMDFANLQMLAQRSVGLQYNVPLPLISDNRQTQHNYGTAVLALYDDAVLPNARRLLGGLSELLLPRYGLDPRKARIIADQDSVTALVVRRNEELKKRAEIGVESANEIRAYMGREPFEGGDTHYVAAAMVPVGTDIWTRDNAADELEPVLGGAG